MKKVTIEEKKTFKLCTRKKFYSLHQQKELRAIYLSPYKKFINTYIVYIELIGINHNSFFIFLFFCVIYPLALGAAYGTAKSGTGIAAMSVMRPELIMKSIIPVVMAGIIAIYGLVVAVLIAGQLSDAAAGYTLYK